MLGLGFTPKYALADMPRMPKRRYGVMTKYMPKVGSRGLDMMYRTCTIQVNLDFATEADMVQKLRVSLALQPIAQALFAASPFTEGKPNVSRPRAAMSGSIPTINDQAIFRSPLSRV
jgi:glutamate--cysteine ligase